MPSSTQTLASLRELLNERYPQAGRPPQSGLPTGIAALDEKTGGLPRHALTELVCATPSCGGQLFLWELLRAARDRAGRIALIDGHDAFDPASCLAVGDDPARALRHLVWVRCRGAGEAIAAADLFARDANLELVALDLRRSTPPELRRIPARTWYRLQRAVEQTDLALLVLTPAALVPSAQLRLMLERPHTLAALGEIRRDLFRSLVPRVGRQRALGNLAAG